jgi:hypothetical protein
MFPDGLSEISELMPQLISNIAMLTLESRNINVILQDLTLDFLTHEIFKVFPNNIFSPHKGYRPEK